MSETRHPAKYTKTIIPILREQLEGCKSVLDPFAGTGRIFQAAPHSRTVGVEIEPEWARITKGVIVGNALFLPFASGSFDAVCTSPVYGNRMSDHHDAKDGSRRNTYRHCLGRKLHPQNAGQLQWGEEYRLFHAAAWREALRVIRPGGRFVLNVSDHIRKGERVKVVEWHMAQLQALGFALENVQEVPTPRQRFGSNGEVRVECEYVLTYSLPRVVT